MIRKIEKKLNVKFVAGYGILWCFLLAFLMGGLLGTPEKAFAYSRNPSGNPAEEPITFNVDAATDNSSNCVGGYQTVAIQWQSSSPYSTIYYDWKADAAQIEWSELTCEDASYEQGDNLTCEDDFTVYDVLVICNDTAAYDETWSAYVLSSDDFTWQLASTSTPPEEEPTSTTSTTETISTTTLAFISQNVSIITFGICIMILGLAGMFGWWSIRDDKTVW